MLKTIGSSAIPSTSTASDLPPVSLIFGHSPRMRAIREKIQKIASSNVPVLILGESGTGKDLIARLIHNLSPWHSGPWVKVNCSAIPASLFESELFGYERGAFTGAYESKPGKAELADRGTLFLDEITELHISMQAKLLQLLQDGQFCRIGAQADQSTDVRVISSTSRDLEREVEDGTFRTDLFYRINVLGIHLPPLRERPDDIPGLVEHFLEMYSHRYKCTVRPIAPRLISQMQAYSWPGNIRQLENLVRRYIIVGSVEMISAEVVARHAPGTIDIPLAKPVRLKELSRAATREFERKVILKVLDANHWNRRTAARFLNISYRALLYKMRDAGITSEQATTGRTLAAEENMPNSTD